MTITRLQPLGSALRWDPWGDFTLMRETLNRTLEDMLGRREEGFLAPAWIPPVDVYENPETIVLKAEVPGVAREDIGITVEQNVLTIKGERKIEREAKEEDFFRIERRSGSFCRSFTLPHAVAPDAIQATLRDGVLEVRLPKVEEAKPRKIQVS